MKTYHVNFGVGQAKYLLSFHDGVKTHNDGSPFFDISIITNKKDLKESEEYLLKQGYKKV